MHTLDSKAACKGCIEGHLEKRVLSKGERRGDGGRGVEGNGGGRDKELKYL